MKPVWKWIIGIIGALLIIVLVVAWYLGRNWKPMLETKLQEVIHDSTNGLYTLTYDDLDLNILLGNVTLINAELRSDSTVYQQLIAKEKAPDNRFHIKLNTLKIRRLGLSDILFGKALDIKNITLESPEVHMISDYHAFNDTISNDSPKSMYDNIKESLNSIQVKNIGLSNATFKLTKTDKDRNRSEMQLDSVQIQISDVLIDEDSDQDSTRIFYTKMIDVVIPGFEYDLPDEFYRIKFSDLHVNTQDGYLQLANVTFRPKMSKSAFFKQKNMNVTMADLRFDTIRMEKVNFRNLLDQQIISAQKMYLKDGATNLYMDKRYPGRPGSRIGQAPHQQIMKLKQPINIDTVFLENVDVLYSEFSAKFHQEGVITFNSAKGTITNVTNDSVRLNKDRFMRADLRAKIMNSGNLHAQFGFDLLSANGAHTYKGSLGAMDATAFNRIMKPLLNVEIGSGNIRKITFDMKGTDYRNWGDFRFDYDNMKIRLLNEKGEDGSQSSKKILSFLVNKILINDSNPDANEKYHIGKVTDYKRDPKHSFFKTLWQSLLEGIKQTAGIGADREAQLTGTATKAKTTINEGKSAVQKTGSFIKGIFKKKDKTEDE